MFIAHLTLSSSDDKHDKEYTFINILDAHRRVLTMIRLLEYIMDCLSATLAQFIYCLYVGKS